MSQRANVLNTNMLRLALALPFTLMAAGCATDSRSDATSSVSMGASAYANGDVSSLTYRAVDLILAAAPEVTAHTPVIVSSISDARNLERSSAFGNIVSDMIRTRLAQDGHTASEIRLRSRVGFSRGEGEFLLSRNPRALMSPPYAAAIITGTYAASFERVYVSIKLVSSMDAHIISGADFVVSLHDLSGLLQEASSEP